MADRGRKVLYGSGTSSRYTSDSMSDYIGSSAAGANSNTSSRYSNSDRTAYTELDNSVHTLKNHLEAAALSTEQWKQRAKDFENDLHVADEQAKHYKAKEMETAENCRKLKEERDQAIKKRGRTCEERDQANGERDHAIRERDQAIRERDQAIRERDQAIRDRDQATEERDQAREKKEREIESLKQGKENLKMDKDRLILEKKALGDKLSEADSEIYNLREEVAKANAQYNALLSNAIPVFSSDNDGSETAMEKRTRSPEKKYSKPSTNSCSLSSRDIKEPRDTKRSSLTEPTNNGNSSRGSRSKEGSRDSAQESARDSNRDQKRRLSQRFETRDDSNSNTSSSATGSSASHRNRGTHSEKANGNGNNVSHRHSQHNSRQGGSSNGNESGSPSDPRSTHTRRGSMKDPNHPFIEGYGTGPRDNTEGPNRPAVNLLVDPHVSGMTAPPTVPPPGIHFAYPQGQPYFPPQQPVSQQHLISPRGDNARSTVVFLQ